MIITNLLAIILGGLFDRAGGDDDIGGGKNQDRFMTGVIGLAVLTGFAMPLKEFWQAYFIYGLLYAFAMAQGYRHPWGAITGRRQMVEGQRGWHWWQKGSLLTTNRHAAMFVRALLSAVIMAPASIYLKTIAPSVSIFLGFWAAPYLSVFLHTDAPNITSYLHQFFNMGKEHKTVWNVAEFLRGAIVITTLVVFP